MDNRLQTIADEHDVIAVITEMFLATDRRDWSAVRRCFAPQVLFDMTSLAGGEPERKTPEQIADGWRRELEPIDAVHHQLGNFQVSISGESAHAVYYGTAYHYRAQARAGTTRMFVGGYECELERESGDWRIRGLRFDCKFVDGNKELERS